LNTVVGVDAGSTVITNALRTRIRKLTEAPHFTQPHHHPPHTSSKTKNPISPAPYPDLSHAQPHPASKQPLTNQTSQTKSRTKAASHASVSLTLFKQQVMLDVCSISSCLVCVETPPHLLHVLNVLRDILVMINLYASPFFQPEITSSRHV